MFCLPDSWYRLNRTPQVPDVFWANNFRNISYTITQNFKRLDVSLILILGCGLPLLISAPYFWWTLKVVLIVFQFWACPPCVCVSLASSFVLLSEFRVSGVLSTDCDTLILMNPHSWFCICIMQRVSNFLLFFSRSLALVYSITSSGKKKQHEATVIENKFKIPRKIGMWTISLWLVLSQMSCLCTLSV